ncbi:hypothetical protein [Gloeocapsopsis dulcis]|uniref:Min27-like integrase DNA-binding domain-containing protein n=1 Tax=Gloeocapsopsis dulcis AAB1 = 1H9 TaxID=1433147 RepID=A0A6N8G2K3_9CHRO|nr:hypothetical protein [Gloeocapsopsis dulcis]MUL39329.1 hypothetical protein [Gloeocapsopsis dulcis AAB1 = 1H9]WNN91714.1 hypothetical protein P0S91_11865 [Gloeocapsopsis dulcis]
MAQSNLFTGKERLGKITIERFRDSLRLRWTLKGKTYSLTIGKDSRDTLKAARAKAQVIDSDITFDRFRSYSAEVWQVANNRFRGCITDTSCRNRNTATMG